MATGNGFFSPFKQFQKFLFLEIRRMEMMNAIPAVMEDHHPAKAIFAELPSKSMKLKKKFFRGGIQSKKEESWKAM